VPFLVPQAAPGIFQSLLASKPHGFSQSRLGSPLAHCYSVAIGSELTTSCSVHGLFQRRLMTSTHTLGAAFVVVQLDWVMAWQSMVRVN